MRHDGRSPRRGPPSVVLARQPLADLVALVLRHLGLETVAAASPVTARALTRRGPPLAIIDTSIPGADALLALRDQRATVALIDLARHGSSFRAFNDGADQVVRLPFTPDELAIRTAALLRRRGDAISLAREVPVGDLELSLDEKVNIGSRTVVLGPTLNSLLYLLVARAPHGVTRHDIERHVWGIDGDGTGDRVDRAVADLARNLGEHDGQRWVIESDQDTARLGERRPA